MFTPSGGGFHGPASDWIGARRQGRGQGRLLQIAED